MLKLLAALCDLLSLIRSLPGVVAEHKKSPPKKGEDFFIYEGRGFLTRGAR